MTVFPPAGPAKAFIVALHDIGRHPNVHVVRELSAGSRRYIELLEALPGLSEATIGASLRELDAAELVNRRVEPGPPLRVLYELTLLGQELAPSLVAIERYTQRPAQA